MAVTFMVAELMEDARLVGGMDDGNDDVAEMESDFVSKCSRIRHALGWIGMWHTFLKTVVTLPFLRRSIAALLIYLLDHNLSPFFHYAIAQAGGEYIQTNTSRGHVPDLSLRGNARMCQDGKPRERECECRNKGELKNEGKENSSWGSQK